MRLPAQWARGETAPNARCSFYGPKDIAYIPRIDLFIERSETDLVDYATKYKKAYKQQYPDATFPSEEVATIHGRTAYQFSALFGDGAIMYKAVWTFVAAGDRRFAFSFNCTEAWFGRYERLAVATMRSLRIFPETKASREEMKRYTAHLEKGDRAYRDKKYKEALEAFRAAAACLPKWPDVHTAIGNAHMRLDRHAEAEKAYRKARKLDPKDIDLLCNFGLCLLKLSKHREAARVFHDAIEIQPDFEPAHTNLGSAYLGLSRYEEARKVLEKAVEVDPESASAHYNLGLALEKLGRKKEAARQFRDALSLDPKHQGAKAALDRVQE
ncbi:MAG: tetratricopeptide repeat protein [Planctomycetota bacterium]|jgi:tetratricopeptide (TPR) repeat protein